MLAPRMIRSIPLLFALLAFACAAEKPPAAADAGDEPAPEQGQTETAPAETNSDWAGIKQWVRDSFPGVPAIGVADLRRLLADPDGPHPVLLDVRTPAEFAVSHLRGAISAPTEAEALAALDGAPSDAPVVVYCSVGYRSAAMTEILRDEGFTEARNLEGSIFEWANDGLPVYRDGREVREVHPFDERWGRLLDRELWPPSW